MIKVMNKYKDSVGLLISHIEAMVHGYLGEWGREGY